MVFLPNPARLRMLLVKAPAPNQNCRNSNGNGTGRRPGLATEDSRNPHLSREGVAESYNEDNSPYSRCLHPCEQPCPPLRDQGTTIAGGRERGKSTGVPTCLLSRSFASSVPAERLACRDSILPGTSATMLGFESVLES